MKVTKICLGAGTALLLASMPAFAAGQLSDEKPLQQQVTDEKPAQQQVTQQQQQVTQQQQGSQDQQVRQAGQASLIVRETDDGKGGIKQEVRSLTVTLDLEQMTEEDVEAAFESAEEVDGIHVAMDEDSATEMYPRWGYRRGFYGRPYAPYFYGPRYYPNYYYRPYYYPGRYAAWWLLPFLFR